MQCYSSVNLIHIILKFKFKFQPRGEFRNDNNHGDNHQGDNDIMNRGNRNHSESGRGGRRGGGVGGGVFRGGPPNRGDDRLTRADVGYQ